jgi:hypothetical protein
MMTATINIYLGSQLLRPETTDRKESKGREEQATSLLAAVVVVAIHNQPS